MSHNQAPKVVHVLQSAAHAKKENIVLQSNVTPSLYNTYICMYIYKHIYIHTHTHTHYDHVMEKQCYK